MPSAIEYAKSAVSLAGGLDFVTPKLQASSGLMADCYNFEVSDRLGYKRIDGLTVFDGRANAAFVYSNAIFIKYEYFGMTGSGPEVGEYVKQAEEKFPGIGFVARDFTFGIPEEYVMALIVTDFNQLFKLEVGDVLTTLDGSDQYEITQIGGVELLLGTYDTEQEKFDAFVDIYSSYEDTTTPFPAGLVPSNPAVPIGVTYTPATSMKWYKDRLYITQDANQLGFEKAGVDPALYPNDVIITPGGSEYRVLSVHLTEGNFVEADAAGSILVEKLSGTFETVGGATVERNGVSVGTTDVGTTVLAASSEDTWAGAMYRSKDIVQAGGVHGDQGWEFVETGFVFDYKEGTAYGSPPAPPPLPGRELTTVEVPVNEASGELTFSTGTTPFLGSIWTLEGGASSIVDAVSDDDGVEFIRSTIAGAYGISPITTVTLSTVDMDLIPEDAVLLGLEVGVRARATPTGGATIAQRIQVKLNTANSTVKHTNALTGSFASYTVGGANDLWGSTGLLMEDLRNSTITVALTPTYRAITPGVDDYTTDIDYVYLKVYYQITVSQLFFWDGTDDVTATLVNYSTENGDWADNDAKGQMHVKSITPVPSSNRTYIYGGNEVRTAAGGLGTKIAVVESDMDFAGVASFAQMQAEGSRADIMVANFYGIDDWEAMYAVTGASRAWTYDDFYFRYIYTGLPLSQDKPRHVEFFKHHLALGYKSGNVSMSATGEPTNFNGIDGAVSFDLGDRVTGLGRMPGDFLGVACQSSFHGISGANIDDFTAKILNPSEGFIEYTVVNMGGKIIGCSYAGISTFDQTAAYGDFIGSRLSANISPWLLPRLSGKSPAVSWLATSQGTSREEIRLVGLGNKPVCAIPIKRKNQYRLYFDDGTVLVMTLFGNEQTPVFTMHSMYDGDVRYDSEFPLVPFAHHNSVDSLGTERVHISSYSPVDNPELARWCYELDQGWLYRSGTGDNTIHGTFTLTNNFFDDPFSDKILRKVRAHGMTKGRGEYKVAVANNYNDDFPDDLSNVRWQSISLPRDVDIGQFGATGDFYSRSDIASPNAQGFSLSLRIREVPVNQPPVIFQTLLLQNEVGKADI